MATLSIAQLKGLAQQVGLSSNNATIAAAIAMAESGGNTNAHNPGNPRTGDIENSWGLWQINLLAHPQYTAFQMQNALSNAKAMATISSGGANWNPWGTYTSGAYRKFLGSAGSAGGSSPAVKSGISNGFPLGQCTWWADQHYHDLTGYFVPWIGNAYQWYSGAKSSGWQSSGTPPKGIPSIIVMQPNVQGASGLGHVGVVEKVNNNNTVTVSNMNWASGPVLKTVSGYQIRQTTINVGAGIGFVWAGDTASSTSSNGLTSTLANVAKTFSLAPNADVTTFLATLDNYLQITNPFDVQGAQQDTIAGISFTDPVAWLAGLGTNMLGDTAAIIIRLILIMLGLYLLYRVVANFVDFKAPMEGAQKAMGSIGQSLGPLLAGVV